MIFRTRFPPTRSEAPFGLFSRLYREPGRLEHREHQARQAIGPVCRWYRPVQLQFDILFPLWRKKRRDGKSEYYHQLLCAVIVAPHHKNVLPFDLEPIIRSDGNTKDCCERNAAKRLIPSIATQYFMRRFIVVEDALACNGPHVKLLRAHQMDFVIGAKPASASTLFDAFDQRRAQHVGVVEFEMTDPETGKIRGCRFAVANDLPINDTLADERVNLIEFREVSKKGKESQWSWTTSIEVTVENVMKLATIGRSRWSIENETFNTLKNQGYHLDHTRSWETVSVMHAGRADAASLSL